MNLKLKKIIVVTAIAASIAASSMFKTANAQSRINIRIGETVSHQSYRFRTYFPDHDWGFYRDRNWYGGPGTSIYFSNRNFSIFYNEPYRRRVYSPFRESNNQQILSEQSGKDAIESYLSKCKLRYLKDVNLNLGAGRVKTIDFMVDLNGWTPIGYVGDDSILPVFKNDKRIYDFTHNNRFILIPPSTKNDLENKVLGGFKENGF